MAVQDKYMGNNGNDITIWGNNPVEDFVNKKMLPDTEDELTIFSRRILSAITVDIDKDTGKTRTTFQWTKIGLAIAEETAGYAKQKRVPHINPIENIKEGKAARRRAKVYKEFYLNHIQSGRYQTQLAEICESCESPEKIDDAIKFYLKELKSELENELKKVSKGKNVSR